VVALATALYLPGRADAQAGAINDLQITVEDLGERKTLDSIAPGGTVKIVQGQQVRLRMTATQAGGSARYPSTRFTPNETNHVSVDAVNEQVGTITVTGRRVHEGGGAVPIQYQILEDWRMRDELRTGRVYVQVIERVDAPAPQPQPGSTSRGVELYADEYHRGRRQFFNAGDPDLSNDSIGNDSVSSLKISQGCSVILFEDTYHRGRSVRVESDTPDMGRVGFRNDALSSFQLECR
jgi:hypothetical protein